MRWLVAQGRIEESRQILESIAHTNGKRPGSDFYQHFLIAARTEQAEARRMKKLTWLDLFKTPQLRKSTIMITIAWMVTYAVFDGQIR